jgi:type II secretory pathway component PulK
MKRFRRTKSNRTGVALFILMTSVALLSLVMRELITASSTQATRVRNSADHVQALYLARSSLNLARFVLYIDHVIDFQKQKNMQIPATDMPDDLWATPNNFPLTAEEIQLLVKDKDENAAQKLGAPKDKDFSKHCQNFFDDFPGTAASVTTDLSSKIYLNDLGTAQGKPTFDLLVRLLQPNREFVQRLSEINTEPLALAREIRDYIDPDNENETKGPEIDAYSSLRLDYGPKNRNLITLDELKLVPHIDDVVFEYLSPLVNPYNIPNKIVGPSRINLNTVSKEVFQALLQEIADPEAIAERFIKDRAQNKRIYTADNAKQILNDALQLTPQNIFPNQITGVSDSFKIETTATVNNISVKLETIVSRPATATLEPIIQMRVSP